MDLRSGVEVTSIKDSDNDKAKSGTWLTTIVDDFKKKSTFLIPKVTLTEECQSEEGTFGVDNKTICVPKSNVLKTQPSEKLFIKSDIDPSSILVENNTVAESSLNLRPFYKLNEFYDKLNLNKIRYIFLKSTDTKLMDSKISRKEPDQNDADNNRKETIFEDISDNSIEIKCSNEFNELKGKHNMLLTFPKNKALRNIGRSYSERNNDENLNCIFNERSRSYSHHINEGISDTQSNSSVSGSLLSFFDNKSFNSISSSPLSHNDILLKSNIRPKHFVRNNSFLSDSSQCSSVESLLESRKPDPEAILINLGFGPTQSEDVLSKIPTRFLKPSQVKGINTETFLRQQQLASHLYDHSVLGYRGLVGNPDIPPSMIVAKIMERFELNERNHCIWDSNSNRPHSAPPGPNN